MNRNPIKIAECEDNFFINWTETQHHKLNLYVRNLLPDLTVLDVEKAFSKFGKIRNVVLFDYFDEENRSGLPISKYGNVIFIFPADAEKALAKSFSELKLLFVGKPFLNYHETKVDKISTLPKYKDQFFQPLNYAAKLVLNKPPKRDEDAVLVTKNKNDPNYQEYAKTNEEEKAKEVTKKLKLRKTSPIFSVAAKSDDDAKEEKLDECVDMIVQKLNENFGDDLSLQIVSTLKAHPNFCFSFAKDLNEDSEKLKCFIGRLLYDILGKKERSLIV